MAHVDLLSDETDQKRDLQPPPDDAAEANGIYGDLLQRFHGGGAHGGLGVAQQSVEPLEVLVDGRLTARRQQRRQVAHQLGAGLRAQIRSNFHWKQLSHLLPLLPRHRNKGKQGKTR